MSQKNLKKITNEIDQLIITEENESDSEVIKCFEEYASLETICPEKGNIMPNHTTMFMNKYSEDPSDPSVANKMATMIVELESYHGVSLKNEIVEEEEFLKIVFEYDQVKAGNMKEDRIEIEDQIEQTDVIENIEEGSQNVQSPSVSLLDEIPYLVEPSTEQDLSEIATESIQIAKKASKMMEKICVAPGETGTFKNWGQDIFLEEKCFPENFPFGTGGYLSADDPEKLVGFAEYCVGQLRSKISQ